MELNAVYHGVQFHTEDRRSSSVRPLRRGRPKVPGHDPGGPRR
jgi:hypothetical protein